MNSFFSTGSRGNSPEKRGGCVLHSGHGGRTGFLHCSYRTDMAPVPANPKKENWNPPVPTASHQNRLEQHQRQLKH